MNKLYFLATLPFLIYLFSFNINSNQNNLVNCSYTYSTIPQFLEDNHYYLYYYNKIDDIFNKTEKDNSNIMVNLNYLAKLQSDRFTIFKSIVDYAYHKNVFVWIKSTTKNNLAEEYKFYDKILNLNYTNVGISLAANNKDIHRKIDSVLERNGSVRLVYGYYLGNIKDRDIIKENYRISAGRLIDSCCNHILSIYDIDLLENLNISYQKFSKINLSFNLQYFHRISDKIEKFSNSINLEIFEGNYLYDTFKYFWDLGIYNLIFGTVY